MESSNNRRRRSVAGGRQPHQQRHQHAEENIRRMRHDNNRNGGPPDEWYRRWKNHMIIRSLNEVSNLIQHGIVSIDIDSLPATLVRWCVLPMGTILGGFGVHLARYIINMIVYYLPMSLVYIILAIVVLGGPDILPPLTLANGQERLIDRLKWTAPFTFIHYSHYLPELLKGYELPLSSYNIMAFMSGIWHFDRGDYNHAKFSHELGCNDRMREYFMREENINTMTQQMMLFHFQAAAGVGMVWAACGIYSFTAFFMALALLVVVHFFVYYCLGGSELDEEAD
mmetsp:Transcript_3450/g.8765  ORF Transcript_3450/g.8765 Transcript_3450/m.8765 type:complete len:283 (-) Transcript_3450:1890-2738(-)